jgi:hypothetical protein
MTCSLAAGIYHNHRKLSCAAVVVQELPSPRWAKNHPCRFWSGSVEDGGRALTGSPRRRPVTKRRREFCRKKSAQRLFHRCLDVSTVVQFDTLLFSHGGSFCRWSHWLSGPLQEMPGSMHG